jgi:hypothetical protein
VDIASSCVERRSMPGCILIAGLPGSSSPFCRRHPVMWAVRCERSVGRTTEVTLNAIRVRLSGGLPHVDKAQNQQAQKALPSRHLWSGCAPSGCWTTWAGPTSGCRWPCVRTPRAARLDGRLWLRSPFVRRSRRVGEEVGNGLNVLIAKVRGPEADRLGGCSCHGSSHDCERRLGWTARRRARHCAGCAGSKPTGGGLRKAGAGTVPCAYALPEPMCLSQGSPKL